MVNELGITKETIEKWTKDAVKEQVNHIISTVENEYYIQKVVADFIRDEGRPDPFFGTSNIERMILKALSDKIELSVKLKGE
jgi:hypothetical protein